jgi:PAS domain S-box-containing protein
MGLSGSNAATACPPFFWATFHRSPQPMAVFEPNTIFVKVNDAFTKVFGYTREEVVGRSLDPLIAPTDRAAWRDNWHVLLRRGQGEFVRELVHANGRQLRIRGVAERGVIAGRGLVLSVALTWQSRRPALTKREAELVGHVAMGKRAHEIASELHLATSTVQTHLSNAMAKFGATSQAQLVALALTRGELGPQLLG